MLDSLSGTSLYLGLFTLLTSFVALFSFGHVTTLALKLRSSCVRAPDTVADGIIKREWYHALADGLSVGRTGANMPMELRAPYMSSIPGWPVLEPQRLTPVRTPPPSPPGSISHFDQYHPRPLSMAKLIMHRHTQRKSPSRSRISKSRQTAPTTLRREPLSAMRS